MFWRFSIKMTVIIFSDFGVKHFENLFYYGHCILVLFLSVTIDWPAFFRTLSNGDKAQYLIKVLGLVCT